MSTSTFFINSASPRIHAAEPPAPLTPSSRVLLEYLNEGGANVVFMILPETEGSELPAHLQGRLLRLRKDLPHVPTAREQLTAFDEHFKPLFPHHSLVQHSLVELDGALPALLNEALGKLNRPSHRLQDFLPAKDTHGLLMTDMTPAIGDILLQVKPKWLTQSPNAPPNAKRCRTCALRAQRTAQRIRTATDAQGSCPLELVSSDAGDRKRAAQKVTIDQRLQDHLVDNVQPLLQTLRENQLRLDSKGVLKTTSSLEILNLCKAMTVRDCTLFLKRSGNTIEAKLADLDFKQPEKLDRWKKVEHELINLGWYDNTEPQQIWKQETVCLLSR
ncbi:Inositol-pentakisphosphate 2-kinase [Vermiconidia calcicola]|uniref:Inositol-pentakisphosphate 2-kinase n=1 Tax=Vermiconidia calcicola TaxID=1690605 RepID=A0ACC3MBZ6_9PEZI|nr:Inositol-pentakisphosphate 2-kinase [Vermiconidia calcicola]